MRKVWGEETSISNIFSSAPSLHRFHAFIWIYSSYGVEDVVIHVPSYIILRELSFSLVHFTFSLTFFYFDVLPKCSVLMDSRSTTSQRTELNESSWSVSFSFSLFFLIFGFSFHLLQICVYVFIEILQSQNIDPETTRQKWRREKNSIKKKQRKWRKMLNLPCISTLTRRHL